MRAPSKWKHPSHPKKVFVGKYERSDESKKRILVLTCKETGTTEIFESHEKAKDAKWKKIS